MDSLWAPQYYQKVLTTNPIAYWMLDEKSGAIAYDMVSGRVAGAQNGAHTGVTLMQPGIGDGRTSPYYDGANDYTNVYSAAFAAAWNGSEGSIAIWAKVSAAGVWTDGTQRELARIAADANNYIDIYRAPANNRISLLYRAGGVTEALFLDGLTSVDWLHIAMTWSASAGVDGEVRIYLNGVQVGATATALGVWAGAPAAATTLIGAYSAVPASVWSGYLAHIPVWTRALPADTLASLAVLR